MNQKTKIINTYLPPAVNTSFKRYCFRMGVHWKEIIEICIQNYLMGQMDLNSLPHFKKGSATKGYVNKKIRIPMDVYEPFKKQLDHDEVSVSSFLRACIENYLITKDQ